MKIIRGAKGGGGQPIEDSDTLRSIQRAEIVDLLGEGRIGGLVNGLKSVYLDGVPVENADGSRNVNEFGHYIALGGPSDTAPPHAFGDVQTEVGVNVTVAAALPVTRTIADVAVDSVRVTIRIPQMIEVRDNGDRVGSSFEWAIEVQSNGGGFLEKYRDTVTGKCSSPYLRAVRVDLKAAGPAPWDIRVRRLTPDSASANILNAFEWSSYTALSGVKMLYRHSAAVWLSFDAKAFSAVPTRSYDVMGISDWDIPVNYDPLARTVAGSWNGTFKQGWTNNPAWVFYNLATNRRYGLGEYTSAPPDKWTLYQLAQWCDAPVPDGRGGTEPRYTINAEVRERGEALRVLQDICAVFRGAMLHTGTALSVTWDAPGTPVAIYAPANVVDGLFTYAEGSLAGKRSSCTCWYTDRSQAGKRVPATWDDPGLVAKYGMRTMEINPSGIASPGQALRMAKWALYTTELEDQTCSFRVGTEGVLGRVGEIFQVADPSEAGERLGGRLKSATAATLILDAPVTLAAGETYTLWVAMPDPADPKRLKPQERVVTNAAGVHNVLTVATPFSEAPQGGAPWVLEGSDVAPTLWRYVSIREARNNEGGLELEVMGVRHLPGKFDLIENNQPLTIRPTRRLSDASPKPLALQIAENVYLDGPMQRVRATASWTAPAAGLRYLVAWRLANGPWTALPPTTGNTVDIDGLQAGLLDVQVQSQNVLGALSLAVEGSLLLTGLGAPPPDVTGLNAAAVSVGIEVRWDRWDSGIAGETELRYGASWASGTQLFRGRANTYTAIAPPPGTYTIWIKHHDITGERESVGAASVTIIWDGVNLFSVLTLSSDSKIFKVDPQGAGTPASITFTAGGQNLGGTPAWAITQGTATLGGAANSPTRTLAYADMATDMVEVQVTWDGQVDREKIFKLRDGTEGWSWDILNSTQNVPCDSAGVPLVAVNLSAQMAIARGAEVLTTGVSYAVVGSTGFESAGTTAGASANVQINASTGVITITKITSTKANATFRATVGGRTFDAVMDVTKVLQGLPGQAGRNNATIPIYRRSVGTPALPSATTTYNFSTKVLTGLTNGWATTWPAPGAGDVYVSAATASSTGNTVDLAPGEWAGAVLGPQNGQAGQDGTSAATVTLYQRTLTNTAPAKPTLDIVYTFATGVASGGLGSWTQQVPPSGGGPYLWAILATALAPASQPTDTLAPAEWSPQRLYSQDGAPGGSGQSTHRIYRAVSIGAARLTPPNTVSGATPSGWSSTPLVLGTGQEQYISDGVTAAGQTTTVWGLEYPSYLKVGSLDAISANMGTITAGSISTTGYVVANGSTGVSLLDPMTFGSSARTVAVAGNLSGAQQVGVVGFTNAPNAVAGVYAYNASSTGHALVAFIDNTSNAQAAIYALTYGGVGSAGLKARGNGPGTYGAIISGGGVNGPALLVTGSATFQHRVSISNASGAELQIANPNLVTNLNADLLDGFHASAFATVGSAPWAFHDIATGGAAASFNANNKPGGFSGSNTWALVFRGGTWYTFPLWQLN